jgi:hypothetical protein
MLDLIDYNEPATLMAYGQDKLVPQQTQVTTLAEAVRTVVEDWGGESPLDIFIATAHGPVQGLDAVQAIYRREDFPLARVTP